jgi:rod shape-determining protein MreC
LRRRISDTDAGLTQAVNRTLVGAVVIAGILLFVLWRSDNPRLERLRLALTDWLVPSVEMVGAPMTAVTGMVRDTEAFVDLYAQNRTLRREIQRLYIWRETARQLEEENAQLRALNNLSVAPRITFVAGDVIADSGGPFLEAALVDVGSRDGVIDGSAAVDGLGLVGRVSGVGERASRLLLLTDFSSRVPVVVQPDGRRAIMAGDGTPAPLIEFLDATDRARPGDLVETSGDGGVFPPNLPVGRVIETESRQLRVALNADYARLEFVRVLRYQPDTRIQQPGGLILPGGGSVGLEPLLPGRN